MLKEIRNYIFETIEENPPRRLFGLVMIANFVIYFFLFDFRTEQAELSLILRSIAILLCIPLITKSFLQEGDCLLKTLYWYIALTYCLPFFFTLMTFLNNLSTIWLMNAVSANFLLILIVRLRVFLILLSIGALLAFIFYTQILHLEIIEKYKYFQFSDIIYTYFAIVVIGGIFTHNKESKDKKAKNRARNKS